MRLLSHCIALGALAAAGCAPTIAECTKVEPPPPFVPPPAPTAQYVLVEYVGGGEYATAPQVEVKDTPKYRELRGKLRSAAIRLPDSCLNETASKVTGVAQRAETIFQTTCGPWLSEIERALASDGFKVFSWDALWKLEKQRNLSTYNAGKELGADVVFVFNSLEAGDILAGSSSQGKYRYFESNAQGRALAPKLLDEATRTKFKGFVQSVLSAGNKAEQVSALSSIIDSTAVITESGESVWFYRRVVTIPTRQNQGMKFLFGRYPDDDWSAIAPVVPGGIPAPNPGAPADSGLSAEDTVGGSVAASQDPFKAERLELIRTGAKEFVQAFKGEGQ